ncbi:MBL fold metallo-hydrolase [Edaphobacter sp. HDX4]|uniref:MBL fold metallo-hydrolase n=1 Tax=Edaphobacter sp. HDX4 TaxID=2794064 RepID=UPI002FE5F574
MKIRFVSHASFSIESNGTTLLCDPWLFGKAFNQGWALLSPAAPVPWEDIDYVWISHQHPDHLHFPTLKSLTAEQRSHLTMLYQKHASERIPKVLRGLGYATVNELTLHKWQRLRGGIEVMCGSAGSMDSWIAVRAEGMTVLNLNDCVISPGHLAWIAKHVGDVTILLTQFSFANWIGNHADELGEAERKVSDLQFRVKFLHPEITIPFASFIYFCNQENSWMNTFSISPQRIAELNLPGVNFMYPGDEWDSHERRFNSEDAVLRYMTDLAMPKVIDPTPASVPVATIEQSVNRTLRAVRGRFGRFLIGKIQPFSIYLHDCNQVLVVDPAGVCQILAGTEDTVAAARYIMCSQVAWYAFAYSWGWGALEVSGMYLDRDYRATNRLAFYLNLLSTECVRFDNAHQTLRTMEFLWAKRHEVWDRVLQKWFPGPGESRAAEGRQMAPATLTGAEGRPKGSDCRART